MRSPMLRLVAGLLLLTACGKKKDGPTNLTGALAAPSLRVASAQVVATPMHGAGRAT